MATDIDDTKQLGDDNALDPSPEVEAKETKALLRDGRKMMRVAVRRLIERIEGGKATAAELNAAARFAALLGLDRPSVVDDPSEGLRRQIAELDAEGFGRELDH